MASLMSSFARSGSDFLASARRPRITPPARAPSRTMLESEFRASSRSGLSRFSHRKAASPLVTMAASGWLISCASEAASSPIVVSRATRARSAWEFLSASSARLRSVMSMTVPTNSISPDSGTSGWPTHTRCLTDPSGGAIRYSCWNRLFSRTALSRVCSNKGRSSP